MDRRKFLLGTLGLGAGAVIGSCADSEQSGGATTAPPRATPAPQTTAVSTTGIAPTTTIAPTSISPTTTAAPGYDPGRPFYAQGNFLPVRREVEELSLTVRGTLPPELTGTYVRNGSNAFSGDPAHWFIGDGMVHGVRLESGRARWYRNRWVRTKRYEDQVAGREPPLAPGGDVGQANVSVFGHAGRLFASGEVGWPWALDAELGTVGVADLAAGSALAPMGGNVTAHPKRDPATGNLHFFGYGFAPPFLTYYVADPAGAMIHKTDIALGAGTMIHDFAITDRDVVFWEFPILFDLQAAIAGSALPFTWTPSYGSRVGVMPLGGTGDTIRWVEIENGYVFHGTNARRTGDRIELLVSKLASVFDGGDIDATPSTLHRWVIDTAGPALRLSETALGIPLDLPTIDPRHVGRDWRAGFYVASRSTPDAGLEFMGLARFDAVTEAMERWEPGPAVQPNEALFVPASDSAGEGEGWLLTYVWERATDSSALAILDATDLAAGPVATVELPQRVPFGFHGTWLAG